MQGQAECREKADRAQHAWGTRCQKLPHDYQENRDHANLNAGYHALDNWMAPMALIDPGNQKNQQRGKRDCDAGEKAVLPASHKIAQTNHPETVRSRRNLPDRKRLREHRLIRKVLGNQFVMNHRDVAEPAARQERRAKYQEEKIQTSDGTASSCRLVTTERMAPTVADAKSSHRVLEPRTAQAAIAMNRAA
jgi:hypothetical protein